MFIYATLLLYDKFPRPYIGRSYLSRVLLWAIGLWLVPPVIVFLTIVYMAFYWLLCHCLTSRRSQENLTTTSRSDYRVRFAAKCAFCHIEIWLEWHPAGPLPVDSISHWTPLNTTWCFPHVITCFYPCHKPHILRVNQSRCSLSNCDIHFILTQIKE